jgi:hypothetical protein
MTEASRRRILQVAERSGIWCRYVLQAVPNVRKEGSLGGGRGWVLEVRLYVCLSAFQLRNTTELFTLIRQRARYISGRDVVGATRERLTGTVAGKSRFGGTMGQLYADLTAAGCLLDAQCFRPDFYLIAGCLRLTY